MNKRKKTIIFRVVNTILVVGFGIFLVYYLIKEFDITRIKEALLGVDKTFLIIGLIIMGFNSYFRAYRKTILLGSSRIGMGDMFLVALIRNAFNMVLPARTGELSYIYVLKRKFKFPIEIGVSTLAIALVFDLIIVFVLIIVSIVIVGINAYDVSSTTVIIIASLILAAAFLILIFLSRIVAVAIWIFNRLFMRHKTEKNKVAIYIYKKLVSINENIKTIQKRKIYWKVFLSSIGIRIFKFTSYYLLIYALLKPLGYSFSDLNYWIILLATAAAEISAVLPTHALAGFGTYEFAFVSVAVILGIGTGIATIVGFGYHIINLIFTVSLGIISMVILAMPFYKIRD